MYRSSPLSVAPSGQLVSPSSSSRPSRVTRLSAFVPRPILTRGVGDAAFQSKKAASRVSFFLPPPSLAPLLPLPAPSSPRQIRHHHDTFGGHSSLTSSSSSSASSSLLPSAFPSRPFSGLRRPHSLSSFLSSPHSSTLQLSLVHLLRYGVLLFFVFSALFLYLNVHAVESSLSSTRWYLQRRNLNFQAIADRVHMKDRREEEEGVVVIEQPTLREKRRTVYVPHCNLTQPCTFPHATVEALYPVFVTSTPDPSLCVGHQFSQWLYGPYLAYETQSFYVYSPPFTGPHGEEFNAFLGLGEGEVDLTALRGQRPSSSRELVDRTASFSDVSNADGAEVKKWMGEELKGHSYRKDEAHVRDTTTSTVLTLNATALPTVSSSPPLACHPQLNVLLRQKYCLARVKGPPVSSVFSNSSSPSAPALTVAFSLQCSEGCYGGQPFLSLDSIVTTIHHLSHTAKKRKLPPPHIHFFVEQEDALNHLHPTQGGSQAGNAASTAVDYFTRLSASPLLSSTPMTLHSSLSSTELLHALVVADVFVASNSPFSHMAAALRSSVTIGHSTQCGFSVAGYHPESGIFNRQVMANAFLDSRRWAVTEFHSSEQCYAMRRWDRTEEE